MKNAKMKIQSLKWFGHDIRMNDGRIAKNLYMRTSREKQPRGRRRR